MGPKTAVKWLTEHGTLDAIMANADSIKGVVGENLRNTLDWLPKARELVTVKTDCDLSAAVADFHALKEVGEDKEKLVAFFTRYGFKTWLREATGESLPDPRAQARARAAAAPAQGGLFDAPAATPPAPGADAAPADDTAPSEIRYEMVTTEAAFEAWMQRIESAPLTAIDTETTSLDPMLAQLVASRCRWNRARPAISLWDTAGRTLLAWTTTASSRAMPCWRACAPGSRMRAGPSSGRTSSTTCMCSPTTA